MNEPKPPQAGLGCGPDGGCGPCDVDVYSWLRAGHPRLALAAAYGIEMVPYIVNVRATFDNPDENLVPEVGSDPKIVSDTVIDQLVCRVTIDRAPQNTFDTLDDYFFNFQSGIEAKLNVVGMPRPAIAPKFTPLSTLCDVVNGSAHWPQKYKWVLTYQQQLQMDFFARIALPNFPVTVVCTFRCWTPDTDKFDGSRVGDRDCLKRLVECGYSVPECYTTQCKS